MSDQMLDYFAQISQIPRQSKNEAAIAAWLEGWAREHGFETRRDSVGNLLISAGGSPGMESAPTVVLQGHLDMVCEKTPDSPHDFSKDPIELVQDGEWLTANQTTLGADNGIAIAMAMAVLTDSDTPHPPIEVLLTVDEETGLTGTQLRARSRAGRAHDVWDDYHSRIIDNQELRPPRATAGWLAWPPCLLSAFRTRSGRAGWPLLRAQQHPDRAGSRS